MLSDIIRPLWAKLRRGERKQVSWLEPEKYHSGSHGWGVGNGWLHFLFMLTWHGKLWVVWPKLLTTSSSYIPLALMVWWRIFLTEFVLGEFVPVALERKGRKEWQRHKSLAFCLFLGNLFPLAWKCGDELTSEFQCLDEYHTPGQTRGAPWRQNYPFWWKVSISNIKTHMRHYHMKKKANIISY